MVVRPPAMLPLVGCEFRQIVGLVRLNDVVFVSLPGLHPLRADSRRDGARLGEMLGAGDFRRFAEHAGQPFRDELVVHVADRRAGREAGGSVALAAFGRHPQLGKVAFLALQFGGQLHVFLGLARGPGDRVDVAVQLDAEAGDRLAGFLDAVDDAVGPAFLDADHHHRCNVRIAPGTDDGAEEQVEVGAELQAPVGVRDRQRTLDVVGDCFAAGV